jgi:hypothetical protein
MDSADANSSASEGANVTIVPGRSPASEILGAIDSVLRSGLPGLSVRVPLTQGDSRREALAALCEAEPRVMIGEARLGPALLEIEMPARARPAPRTLGAIAAVLRDKGLAAVEVAVPGRYGALGARGRLRATVSGSGKRTLRAAEVGLRSTSSRGALGPPAKGDLAAERAEHLRHRARSATMRARMDSNAHRLSRERLQTRHERARLRLAERRLGESGAGEWLRWRSRNVARRAAGLPGAVRSASSSARAFARRARRYAVDRRRSRKLQA